MFNRGTPRKMPELFQGALFGHVFSYHHFLSFYLDVEEQQLKYRMM